jgi:hypothetical protein
MIRAVYASVVNGVKNLIRRVPFAYAEAACEGFDTVTVERAPSRCVRRRFARGVERRRVVFPARALVGIEGARKRRKSIARPHPRIEENLPEKCYAAAIRRPIGRLQSSVKRSVRRTIISRHERARSEHSGKNWTIAHARTLIDRGWSVCARFLPCSRRKRFLTIRIRRLCNASV